MHRQISDYFHSYSQPSCRHTALPSLPMHPPKAHRALGTITARPEGPNVPPQSGEQDGNLLLNLIEGAADGRDRGAGGQSPLPSWGRCKDRSYKCPPQSYKCSPPILNPKSGSWVCSRTAEDQPVLSQGSHNHIAAHIRWGIWDSNNLIE